jgi:FKBP-type peptidyl-prolyl cis-trans isomerase (trigger factor)
MRDELRESADQAVRRALVLGELTEAEEIAVGDEQVEEEIERMASQLGTPGESSEEQLQQVRQLFDTPESRSSIQSQLVTRAALDRLEEIASQTDGDEGETSTRRTSRRRRGAAARAEEAGGASDEDSSEAESAGEDAEQDE